MICGDNMVVVQVSSMWSASPFSTVSPLAFLKKVSKIDERWGEGSQQDSQEFLHR
jgi:ubiquitin C-terminal hydrolase